MSNNQNIIPYVPISERVKAKTEKSLHICKQFFKLIDHCVQAQVIFNHDRKKGYLSISPDQINDLLNEFKKNVQLPQIIDIKLLRKSLNNLIYPVFIGECTVKSPIWNQTQVVVWQFKLNQIANEEHMEFQDNNDLELNLDIVLANIRVWRQSLEASVGIKEVVYKNNDLIYKLLDLEKKLQIVQDHLD